MGANGVKSADWLKAGALFLLVVVAVVVLATRFKISADMGVFMPSAQTHTERLLLSQLSSGATSNLVFASITNAEPQTLAELNQTLAEKFRADDKVTRVYNGENALSKADQNFIVENRYLLSPGISEQSFSEESLKQSLQDRLDGLASATAPIEKKFLRRDPTGELLTLFDQWQNKQSRRQIGPDTLYGVWFSQDHERTLMVIELNTGGFKLTQQVASVQMIYNAFEQANKAGAVMTLSGPSVFAVETNDRIRADLKFLTLMAVIVVGGFLLLAFRSVVLIALMLMPLISASLIAAAAVLLLFGNLHGITLAFGVTLIGVAIDYPIHVFSHLDGNRERVREHVANIWPTLRLGVLTTVTAYGAFVLTQFEGLRQLGAFTIVGLLTAAAVTRWVLPLVMPKRIPVGLGLNFVHDILEKGGRRASNFRPLVIIVLLIAILFLALTEKPLRNLDVDSLSPIRTERRADDKNIRGDLGFWSGGQLVIVAAPDAQTALFESEQLLPALKGLIQQGAINDYDMAAQFLPSQATQRQRQAAIPEADSLRKSIDAARGDLPFRENTFEPFLEEASLAKQQTTVALNDLEGTELGARIGALLFEHEDQWLAPVLLHGVTQPEKVEALAKADSDVQVVFMHLKTESTKVVTRAIDRVMIVLLWGLLLIYGLLAVNFRSLSKPFVVLVPTVSSVVLVSALLVAINVPLSLFHCVALLLVIGLGLDYSLFFNRLTDHGEEWGTTFRALWICSVTTIAVFGVLIFSSTPPLVSVGQTVAIGSALCLVFGAIWSSSGGTNK